MKPTTLEATNHHLKELLFFHLAESDWTVKEALRRKIIIKIKSILDLLGAKSSKSHLSYLYGSFILYRSIHIPEIRYYLKDEQYDSIYKLSLKLLAKFEVRYIESNAPGICYYENSLIEEGGNIIQADDIRKRKLIELKEIKEYVDSVEWNELTTLCGIEIPTLETLPLIQRDTEPFNDVDINALITYHGENAVKHLLYSEFNDYTESALAYLSQSPLHISEPNKFTKLLELFRDRELLEIEDSEIPKLIRVLFRFPTKYNSNYPFEIPKFRILSSDFSNEMKFALRLFRNAKVIEGNVKNIAILFNKVFDVEGMSIRSLENSFKPSQKVSFKVLSTPEVMGVCNISSIRIS